MSKVNKKPVFDVHRHNDHTYEAPAPWDEWDDYGCCWVCHACGAASGFLSHNPNCHERAFSYQPFRFRFYVQALEFGRRLKAFLHVYSLELAIMCAIIIGAFLASFMGGCATEVVKQETPDLTEVAEAYCKANPDLNCGHVYACQTYADNPIGLIELCIPQEDPAINRPTLEQAEGEFGSCELSPDPRFSSSHLCWWCCGPTCGRGCNSYSGCYCPVPPVMPDAGVSDMPTTKGLL